MRITVSNLLRSACAVIGALTLVISGIDNINRVAQFGSTTFWLLLGVGGLFAVGAVLPSAEMPKQVGFARYVHEAKYNRFHGYLPSILVAVVFLLVALWRLWLVWHTVSAPDAVTDPRQPVPPGPTAQITGRLILPLIWVFSLVVGLAVIPASEATAEPSERGLRLVSFSLDEKRSSYRLIRNVHYTRNLIYPSADDDFREQKIIKGVPSFESGFNHMRCAGVLADDQVRNALIDFANRTGKSELVKYIDSESLFKTLLSRRPDVVQRLIPRTAEWSAIADKATFDRVLDWVRDCIGIPYPMFNVMILNESANDCFAISMKYYFLEVYGDEAGGGLEPKTVSPSTVISHRLDFEGRGDLASATMADDPSALVEFIPVRNELREYFHLHGIRKVEKPQESQIEEPVRLRSGDLTSFLLQLYVEKIGGDSSGGSVLLGAAVMTTCGEVRLPEVSVHLTELKRW